MILLYLLANFVSAREDFIVDESIFVKKQLNIRNNDIINTLENSSCIILDSEVKSDFKYIFSVFSGEDFAGGICIELNYKGKPKKFILTTYHSVESKETIKILFRKKEAAAKIFSYDKFTDIALLETDQDLGMIPVAFANENFRKGKRLNFFAPIEASELGFFEAKVVLENWFFDTNSLLNSVDQNKFKNLPPLNFVLINGFFDHGFSGAGVLNDNGCLEGLILGKFLKKNSIGLLIPSNFIKFVLGKMLKNPSGITWPVLPLKIVENKTNFLGGLVVQESRLAEIKMGDIIVEYNKKKLNSAYELKKEFLQAEIEDTAIFKLYRPKEDKYLEIKLGIRNLIEKKLEIKKEMETKIVVVKDQDGKIRILIFDPVFNSLLSQGDQIEKINGLVVKEPQDFYKIIEEQRDKIKINMIIVSKNGIRKEVFIEQEKGGDFSSIKVKIIGNN